MIKKEDKKVLKAFGKKLKSIREAKDLSVRDVSYNCAIDNSKISKIENGQINITLTTILDLAKGLEIDPKELLDF
jgi:transcriptional regulator with XRE-family HTH domain